MKVPQQAPSLGALLERLPPERALELYQRGPAAELDGRYLHWDELRHRTPPEGLSSAEWWFLIASARNFQRTELPLRDVVGRPFTVTRTDGLTRLLHLVDRELGHSQQVAEPRLVNQEVRDRYVVRSIVDEAISSSQLEGAATTRRVAKELLLSGRAPKTTDERMIRNNFLGMELVRQRLSTPLSTELLLELHATLTEGTLAKGEAGRFRTAAEPVTVQEVGTGNVLHVPPPADTLPTHLEALLRFANAGDAETSFVHPVVRAITLHFALGWLHPFVDGNGRTARALFYWSMLRQGYWLTEFLSLSSAIQRAHARYNRAFLFTETDGGDLTYFLLNQLEMLRDAVTDLHAYLDEKSREVSAAEHLMKGAPFLNARQRAFLSHALRHPGLHQTVSAYRAEYAVVYDTARTDLLSLAAAGLLDKRKVGKAFVFDVPADLDQRLARFEA